MRGSRLAREGVGRDVVVCFVRILVASWPQFRVPRYVCISRFSILALFPPKAPKIGFIALKHRRI